MERINKILIANRGEIVSRIIRTCKLMGIQTVIIFTDDDSNYSYIEDADFSLKLYGKSLDETYLNINLIINKAIENNCDAIHPGYGFLSENYKFAKACTENNLIFIGPSHQIINQMASKSISKEIVKSINIPTIPGYNGKDQNKKRLIKEAKLIGFPIILKSSNGGGGKGIKIVTNENEISDAIDSSKRESQNSFGSEELIIEKFIEGSRHIEFQVIGDKYGNYLHLFERECSIQRRYQKILEECPSPAIDKANRKLLADYALKIAKKLKYDNVGTIEFLFDQKNNNFYFMEFNTRLQVEHTVTEMTTDIDLVKLQIEISDGSKIQYQQNNIKSNGHAIEVRLYAEDVNNNYYPDSGIIEFFKSPKTENFRIETSIMSNSKISINYDPMIAKLIVWGKKRDSAIKKMSYVLNELKCLGVKTNQDLLKKILINNKFSLGDYNVDFLNNKLLFSKDKKTNIAKEKSIISGILYNSITLNKKKKYFKNIPSGWRNNFYSHQKEEIEIDNKKILIKYKFGKNSYEFIINDNKYSAKVFKFSNNTLFIDFSGTIEKFKIFTRANKFYIYNISSGNVIFSLNERLYYKNHYENKGSFLAPMPSKIEKIVVKENEKVKKGDPLIVLSSMKMENIIQSNITGHVNKIYVTKGQTVDSGTLLINLR